MAGENNVKPPLLLLFPKRSDCVYTSCFCEENVWKLCQDIENRHPTELKYCHVAFVSNQNRTVPLWRQLSSKEENKMVVWDYHVILIYAPDDRAVVYDLDSELPFPTFFWKYAMETFRRDEALSPKFHRKFRVVSASDYLRTFASNRQHMKRKDGTWIKTPPDYPPICTPTYPDNLDSFIEMNPDTGIGKIMTLNQLFARFYREPNPPIVQISQQPAQQPTAQQNVVQQQGPIQPALSKPTSK
ncbi:protein N-terminal glutamine amidohydrolase [Copidosoma floridanum]|uniref:protein N-terminal glutamine amidohydrolase n=1 Tax=Copidosoma floridanum TaxID=29053 RepID=UPI0006C9AA72|nr:protein N-terminal glutamine amidohydrolase [Copidosoma floridanum]